MGWSNPKPGEGATPFEGKSDHGQSSGEEYFFNLGESCGALCPQNFSPFRFLDVWAQLSLKIIHDFRQV